MKVNPQAITEHVFRELRIQAAQLKTGEFTYDLPVDAHPHYEFSFTAGDLKDDGGEYVFSMSVEHRSDIGDLSSDTADAIDMEHLVLFSYLDGDEEQGIEAEERHVPLCHFADIIEFTVATASRATGKPYSYFIHTRTEPGVREVWTVYTDMDGKQYAMRTVISLKKKGEEA